jgi:hypothetical protein
MAKEARDQQEQEPIPTEKKLEQLYELIDGIETAMLTPSRPAREPGLLPRPHARTREYV